MNPAKRLADLAPSAIRMISDPAGPDVIPLGLGQPTWDLPEPARAALASLQGPCPYGPNAGRVDLRATIASFHGVPGPDHVLVTLGTQGALYCLFTAWLDEGDEVLLPDPGFVAYPALARMTGARIVTYALAANDRFRLDPAAFRAALDRAPRAKLAVLNLPGNPTGGAATVAALREVADACERRDVLVVSDEVYRDLYYDARPASLLDVTDRGAVLSSVSKAFGAPGLRVGWVAAKPDVLKPAATVNGYAATAASYPAQGAALALLENRERVLEEARREVGTRFAALASALHTHLGVESVAPDGSFYYWLPLPEPAYDDPFAFCVRLRDEGGVVLIPGLAFGEGGRRHARLSFAASPAQLEEGVRRFAPFWNHR